MSGLPSPEAARLPIWSRNEMRFEAHGASSPPPAPPGVLGLLVLSRVRSGWVSLRGGGGKAERILYAPGSPKLHPPSPTPIHDSYWPFIIFLSAPLGCSSAFTVTRFHGNDNGCVVFLPSFFLPPFFLCFPLSPSPSLLSCIC